MKLKKDFYSGEKNIILDSNDEKFKWIKIGPNIVHGFRSISKDTTVLIAYAVIPKVNANQPLNPIFL